MELTLLAFLFIGFCFGFTTVYFIYLGWQSDIESELRYWRREALKKESK
jgi:hypothetical protein